MRVGIDVSCWQNPRGFGRFTRELVRQLVHDHASRHEFLLVADRFTAAQGRFPADARLSVVDTRRQPMRAASADGWRSPLDLVRLGWHAARCRADVFLFPTVYSFYPVLGRVPIAVAFHDAMTEQRPDLFFPTRRAHAFWQAKVWLARRQASAIVAPSDSARRTVAAALRWPLESIARIDEAPAAIFCKTEDPAATRAVRSRCGLPLDVPLILYVGALSPHKNVASLLRAVASLRADAGWHLALIGEHRSDSALGCYEEIVALRAALALPGRVTLTGFVSDEDLALLYNAATMLVLPSLDEGFGLPVVEAMACGLPVVVSARGSLPELVGEAGLTFEPDDPSALTRTIARLLDDAGLRRELSIRGSVRAADFTWQRSARQMMAVLEKTAAR